MENLGIIRDDYAQLHKILQEASPHFDILVVSGGSSAGMRDHTLDAFKRLPQAEILAQGAAISPGKPFIFARAGQKYLLGLPGHVTSALVCAREFLLPLIQSIQGCKTWAPHNVIRAIMDRSVASAQGRRDYIRCRLQPKDENWHAIPLSDASAVISGMVEADGLIVCPENIEGLKQGAEALVEILD